MNIDIPISGRSDEGLTAPIIKRLRARGHHVHTTDFSEGPVYMPNVDVCLICGDRTEMVEKAWACFKHHVPIAHLFAGITNSIATFDDLGRHCITLLSDVQFCENEQAQFNVIHLLDVIGKRDNAHIVGITHLDDLEVDESYLPPNPYDLILYNPPTLTQNMGKELEIIHDLCDETYRIIAIPPNADEGRYFILQWYREHHIYVGEGYTRARFLGLLKNCNRFYTNSSCGIYEAPHFLKPAQIIHVGRRNLNRSSKGPLQPGASDKIVKILEDLYGE